MKRRLRFVWIPALILLILALGAAGGVLLDRQVLAAYLPRQDIAPDAADEFKLMAEAWNVLEKVYVDRPALEGTTLVYGAISGMVDALGDTGHSRFLSPEMLQAQHSFTKGQFEGIGAYVEIKDGYTVIVAPMDGSPAQEAGLQPGDIILKVDGEEVTGLPLDQVVERILGPAGTSVTLTILNPDSGQARDVPLVRAQIAIDNVAWQRLPGTQVAHVRIVAFSQGVTDGLKQALAEIQQQGLTGIILDLRNNPGGLLDEAIGTASQFLTGGNVLLTRDAQGQDTPVPVKEGGVAPDVPLVVLINPGTASAAEIVSGALQDAGRAQLVGETSFGTGTVLNEFPLSDGSALLLATQEWLTPKGRLIWKEGIEPDETVTLPTDIRPLLPEAEVDITTEQLYGSRDTQLLRALEVLGGPPAPWVEYRRTGGIAGLDDHLVLYADGRAELDRRGSRSEFVVGFQALDQLAQQLDAAGFSDLPAEALPADPCCDRFDHTVMYQGHTVHTMDGTVPEALQPVLATLSEMLSEAR